MRTPAGVVLALALSASPLLPGAIMISQVSAGDILIAGYGATPCATLNASIQSGDGFAKNALTQGAMSWMQGFVSGANAIKIEATKEYFDLSTISYDEQWAFVLGSCRRNPSQDFSRAVEDMMLHRLRTLRAPPPTPLVKQ
jgi:hypothetical protein